MDTKFGILAALTMATMVNETTTLFTHGQKSVRRSRWYHTLPVILAEVMGAGVLGLPYATARLGLVYGVLTSLICGAVAFYAGMLLVRVKHDLGQSEANSYEDLACALGGEAFGRLTGVVVRVAWAMLLPYFLLASANSVALIVPESQLSSSTAVLITAVILLVPLQLRTLHQISALCLPSSLAVITAIVIILATLFFDDSSKGPMTSPVSSGTFFDFFGNIGAFLFAYMGHSMYLEMMREMVDSREFGSIVLPVATFAMVVCYTGTAVAGVCAYGASVSEFLPNSMPEGLPKRLVGVLLAFHTLVSYLVTSQPLHRCLHGVVFPSTVDEYTPRAAFDWLLVTCMQLLVSLVAAICIPFFADLQGLLGSLTGAAFIFGFPAFFFLRASSLANVPASWPDYVVCVLLLVVLTPLFMVVGTYSETLDILGKWAIELEEHGK